MLKRENKKGLTYSTECENCKKEFLISHDDSTLKYRIKAEIDGNLVFLTYYDCPSCGRRHFVQIDDGKSLRLFREYKLQLIENLKEKREGKTLTEEKISKFNEVRKHLSDYRTKLMKDYTGKSIKMDGAESDFVLRFSV